LYQLANALVMLTEEPKPFEEALERYKRVYMMANSEMMKSKLGLQTSQAKDDDLLERLEKTLSLSETDMTIFYRLLASVSKKENAAIALQKIKPAFYLPEEIGGSNLDQWVTWMEKYMERLNLETISDEERKSQMNRVNPKYVLRNYMAQLAIDEAEKGNYSTIEELHNLLKKPYDEQVEHEKWFAKRPDWARNKVGCSMLSCSS